MFLSLQDVLNWVLPISAGLLIGVLIASRRNSNKDAIVGLPAEEFSKNMRKGQLIDVRSSESYKAGRINGSRNFPKMSVTKNLFKLRVDQPVFLYGKTDSGVVRRAANKLAKKGYNPVYILKEGFDNWPYQVKSN